MTSASELAQEDKKCEMPKVKIKNKENLTRRFKLKVIEDKLVLFFNKLGWEVRQYLCLVKIISMKLR